MKPTRLICSTLFAAATLAALPSCFEKEGQDAATQAPATETPATGQEKPAAPTVEDVTARLTKELGDNAIVTPWAVNIDSTTTNADGSVSMAATLAMTVKEDLFTREEAPAALNTERMACNESLNRAMLPESVYLMQVGAPTELITDADRAPRPLPAELQGQADALKALAETALYRPLSSAGQEVKLTATFKATYKDNAWDYSEIALDKAALAPLEPGIARSALPEGAPIISAGVEDARKAELREKITAFNQAAEPYIKGREDAARTRLAEYRAKQEEELRRAAEQAEAEAKVRQEWEQRCTNFIAEDKQFAGEWTRDNRFGELTLRITRTTRHDNAIHFIGTIYDTKLPAASLDIAGRCDLSKGGDAAQVDITIYDGQYDPDQPTAEVYDADDSLMVLKLTPEGKLEGIMTCLSWKEAPQKAFNISLSSQKGKKSKK